MNNSKIYEILENFIQKDYKFSNSIEFKSDYDSIINYWNKWFIENEYNGITKMLLFNLLEDVYLEDSYIEELNTIFRAHYNSSGNHMILFYISNSKKILFKIKAPNVKNENNIPFWTIQITDKEVIKQMELKNIKKDKLLVLVYN